MISKLNAPKVIREYADNGEHSHYKLIEITTGKILWEEQENANSGYPLLADGWREISNPPTEEITYWVWGKLKDGFKERVYAGYEAEYFEGKWYTVFSSRIELDVTHWQSLPLPPTVS